MCRYRIILILCFSVISVILLSSQRPRSAFTLNFEEGTLRSWTQKGTAFRNQPTYGDNPTARGRGQSANHQGNYWIGTYENYQRQRGQEPGTVQGDEPRGSLRSPNFVIPEGQLSFLIGGGGNSEEIWVSLVEVTGPGEFDQRELFRATGNYRETMERVYWPLEAHAGKTGYLRIVDNSSGSWGHINVDDFRFVPPQAESEVPVPNFIGQPISQVEELFIEEELKLRIGQVTEQESEFPTGTVIDQDPPPNSFVPENTPVHFTVSRQVPIPETATVIVPPLIDRTLPEAQELLADRGLRMRVTGTEASRLEYESVAYQDPEAGTRVPEGSIVSVVKAVPSWVIVPDVIGYSVDEAREILLESNLTLGTVSEEVSASEPGQVINQTPPGGSRYPAGNPVSITSAVPVVTPTAYQVLLSASHTTLTQDQIVRFKASVNPPAEEVRYQFHFGDGQLSAWSSSPSTEYRYPQPGNYQPYVKVEIQQQPPAGFASEPILLKVQPPASPKNWPVIIVISVGILAGALLVLRKIHRKRMRRPAEGEISIEVRHNTAKYEVKATDTLSQFDLPQETIHQLDIAPSSFPTSYDRAVKGKVIESIYLDELLDIPQIKRAWFARVDTLETSPALAGIKTKLAHKSPTRPWKPLTEDIFQEFASCLHLDLIKIILSAWMNHGVPEKYRKSKKIAKGEETTVTIAPHTLKSWYSPDLEVLLNKFLLGIVKFQIGLSFDVDGFILKEENKTITEIHSGQCLTKGTIFCEGIKLYDIASQAIELPGNIKIRETASVSD